MIEHSSALRFGVMCNRAALQRWQADALKELRDTGHSLVLLITDARSDVKTSRISGFLRRKWSVFLFTFLENRFFNPAARQMTSLEKELAGVAKLSCKVTRRGFSEYFSGEDVTTIESYKPDFILRFGFGIIRGDILDAARYGVWSFHHDDELGYRGGPAGFWEIFSGDPVSGAIMQRLTNRLDGGIILKKGYLKTSMHSYRENLEQLLTVSASWPAQAAGELARNPQAVYPESLTKATVYKVPGNLQMCIFLLKLLRNRMRFHFTKLFLCEDWNSGLVRRPLHEVALGPGLIEDRQVAWLPQPGHGKYYADPSGFIADGGLHVLVEEFSYQTQKAVISDFVLPAAISPALIEPAWKGTSGVLSNENHLSYPFIVESGGNVYCVPESYRSGCVALYRRDPASGQFTREKILLAGVEAVDPTLFFHDGLWWLFFTSRKYSNSHLFIYHSSALAGEYMPHAANPVKTDVRSARPAGSPFVHNGQLYRPSQDCSVTYGGQVVVNRVLKLTVDEFAEERVNAVAPVAGSRYGRGLHTLSPVGEFTLIDGKRYMFNPRSMMHQIMSIITGGGRHV